MAQRLTIAGDGVEWTAEVGSDGVRLRGAGDRELPPVAVRDDGDGRFHVSAHATAGDGAEAHQGVAAAAGDHVWVSIRGRLYDFEVTPARGARSGARDQDALVPPMSGTVVRVAVKVGDHVRRGDTLVVLEAMKMELPIRAPRDGVIASVHCAEGQLVQPGHPVVELAR